MSLGELFDATAPVLFRMALSLVPDAATAEDAVQETFLAALEDLDRYDETRPVMPWLVGIMHVMVKRARRATSRVPDLLRVAAHHAEGADLEVTEVSDGDEGARRVRAAIETLSEPYRSVALLRWRYGLSPAEIADVRKEPPGTTRSLLSRALVRLREELKGAPAFLLLPPGARGLEAVREAVLAKGSEVALAAGVGVAAAAATGLSVAAKLGIAAGVLAVAGSAWWVLGPVGTGPGATSPAANVSPAEPDVRESSTPPPPTAPTPPPEAPVLVPEEPVPTPEETAPPLASASPTNLAPTHDPEPATPVPPPETRPPSLGVDPEEGGAPKAGPTGEDFAKGAGADHLGEVPEALNQQIEKAVALGVTWLRQAQLPDGSWGLIEGNHAYGGGATDKAYAHPAGTTALVIYALLKCNVPASDPTIKRGFSFLKRFRIPAGAYETSAMLLAVTATGDPFKATKDSVANADRIRLSGDMLSWAQDLQRSLVEKKRKAKTLGWRYMVEGTVDVPPGGNEDLSSTQLAALALLSAERCRISTDSKVWNEILSFAMRQQEEDGPAHARAVFPRPLPSASKGPSKPSPYAPAPGSGPVQDRARGFAYIRDPSLSPDEGKATGSMTACGLGTIQIARYVLSMRDDKTYRARDTKAVQQAIYDGLAWLDLHWSPYENPEKQRENVYHIYWLYCTERAFDLLGNHLLGSHLWYVEMARQLLPRQSAKGFWDSQSTHKPSGVLDTSFALLFLQKATGGEVESPSVTDPGEEPPKDGR